MGKNVIMIILLVIASFSCAKIGYSKQFKSTENIIGPFYVKKIVSYPSMIRPGDQDVELKVYIENVLDEEFEDITCIFTRNEFFSASKPGRNKFYVGNLGKGGEARLLFYVNVNDSISTGAYELPVTFKYLREGELREAKGNIEVNVRGKPILDITKVWTASKRINPNEVFEIFVAVKNVGTGKARNVEMTLNPDVGLLAPVDIDAFLGSIGPGEQVEATFRCKATKIPPWTYTILSTITYEDNASVVIFRPISIDIYKKEPSEIDITEVTTVPEKVKPGDDFILSVHLKTVGDSVANSVKASLFTKPPIVPIKSDSEIFVGSLGPDHDTYVVNFSLHVDRKAESRQYEFNTMLEYDDENQITHQKNSPFGIVVRGEPNVYIQEITLDPSKLNPKTEGLLIIRFVNVGTERAEDVKVRILGGEKILTQNYNFIGEVRRDETQTASFGVYVDPAKAKEGKYGLNIDVSYKDKFGNSYTNSMIYETSIYSKPFPIPTKYLLTLLGLIVLSFIGYLGAIIVRSHIRINYGNEKE